jgi:hypothetical protein
MAAATLARALTIRGPRLSAHQGLEEKVERYVHDSLIDGQIDPHRLLVASLRYPAQRHSGDVVDGRYAQRLLRPVECLSALPHQTQ